MGKYDSAVALGYKPGNCKDQGYPKLHTGRYDIQWYTKSRRLVLEQEGNVTRFLVYESNGQVVCKQSKYDSAVALGYKPGNCKDQGYPKLHTGRYDIQWYTKSRRLVFEQE